MAILKTEGVVLKKIKVRETSLILHLYTRERGRLKAQVKGVRTPKNYDLSCYEPMSRIELIFYESERSDVHLIKEAFLIQHYLLIRNDFNRLIRGLYLMELLDAAMPTGEKNEEFFDFLLSCLNLLAVKEIPAIVHLFEMRLLKSIGLGIDWENCTSCTRRADKEVRFSIQQGGLFCDQCIKLDPSSTSVNPETVRILRFLSKASLKETVNLKVGRRAEEEISRLLHSFLQYRLERELKTYRFVH